ncbi:hypothetical protein Trco_008228 [Trichoderma cornu-damae]|uniref:Uncharacterized protein n=1 Tax=Trichoderma cornu-damae TaxID=654480 RepID=A0A9P8QIA4_9HYPO|nr:hypothetical protein Trco_008228 [Trichoderma cornu-damae]
MFQTNYLVLVARVISRPDESDSIHLSQLGHLAVQLGNLRMHAIHAVEHLLLVGLVLPGKGVSQGVHLGSERVPNHRLRDAPNHLIQVVENRIGRLAIRPRRGGGLGISLGPSKDFDVLSRLFEPRLEDVILPLCCPYAQHALGRHRQHLDALVGQGLHDFPLDRAVPALALQPAEESLKGFHDVLADDVFVHFSHQSGLRHCLSPSSLSSGSRISMLSGQLCLGWALVLALVQRDGSESCRMDAF